MGAKPCLFLVVIEGVGTHGVTPLSSTQTALTDQEETGTKPEKPGESCDSAEYVLDENVTGISFFKSVKTG
jgi:hypothetical protein